MMKTILLSLCLKYIKLNLLEEAREAPTDDEK